MVTFVSKRETLWYKLVVRTYYVVKNVSCAAVQIVEILNCVVVCFALRYVTLRFFSSVTRSVIFLRVGVVRARGFSSGFSYLFIVGSRHFGEYRSKEMT